MTRKISLFAVLASAVAMLAGCADPVVFSEVFQLEENQKLYTAYNIWYTDPAEISCLNIQQGTFIPVGTEIEPIGTSAVMNNFGWSGFNEKITFRDKEGKVYTIKFSDGYRLCSMRDYIAYTFTTKNREEQLAGTPDSVRKRILRGEVVPGMTEAQVKLCYGPPPSIRTPDLRNDTWFYWLTPSETVRIIFRGGKVRNILNINPR